MREHFHDTPTPEAALHEHLHHIEESLATLEDFFGKLQTALAPLSELFGSDSDGDPPGLLKVLRAAMGRG